MKLGKKAVFYLFVDTAFDVTQSWQTRFVKSRLGAASYHRRCPLDVCALRYFAWYSTNQITWRSNHLCRHSSLQPVAANCVDRGNRCSGTARPNSAYHNARKRAMTRILTPAFISANGNDLKRSLDLDLSVVANVKSIASGIICLYYFTTWANLVASQARWSAFITEHPGAIKCEVLYKYRCETLVLVLMELEIYL